MELTKTVEVHRFVYDEEQIKRFARLIDTENGYHQLCLFVRPKYHTGVKNRNVGIRTFYGYTPEVFLEQVKKHELPVGSYKDNGTEYPNDCFVLYSSTNTRDGKKAAKMFIDELLSAAFEENKYIFNHLKSRLDSTIMSSKGKTKYLTIDIDAKDEWPEVKDWLAEKGTKIDALIETRGGYHVMINMDEIAKLKGELHKKFASKHTIGDMMCAVPGTLQGGFPVRFVD
jgi:hypothetical protein